MARQVLATKPVRRPTLHPLDQTSPSGKKMVNRAGRTWA